jgi:5'-methylthioadenosine phosphorylase
MFAMLGGDVVGMTNMPECILAREAEMCYSTCSIVTNMAAGISPTPLSHMEVVEAMGKSISRMNKLIEAFIAYNEPVVAECDCHHALREFGGFKL